ncbi:MAG: serine hydrolase domain-containing protein [Acidimicrobiia bacterium]
MPLPARLRVGSSRLAVVTVAIGVIAAACGSSHPTSTTTTSTSRATTPTTVTPSTARSAATSTTTARVARKALAPDAFDGVDAHLEQRVRAAGTSLGFLRIVDDDGTVLHDHSVGGMRGSTPLGIASSAKWLTAATFMTFVDQRAIALDDDIARWLPEFAGSSPLITARQLLDHTSGVHDHPCQSDGTALATCVRTLAASPREFPAGTAFSYGNSPFLVVGRLIEVLGNADFATVVAQRLTGPLQMTDTTWPGAPSAPSPAFGATVTVDDYGSFLAMILDDGMAPGGRVLSRDAVHQIVANQVADHDTTHDYSVGLTQIPRYGLGCWPDVVDGRTTVVVSGNGGKGFYPWVDFSTRTWGVLGVQDERGAQYAVPASQAVEVEARAVVTG